MIQKITERFSYNSTLERLIFFDHLLRALEGILWVTGFHSAKKNISTKRSEVNDKITTLITVKFQPYR